MNKTFTVLINVLIWDNHASAVGIFSLFVYIGGSTICCEAPLRKKEQDAAEDRAKDVQMGKLLSAPHNQDVNNAPIEALTSTRVVK